MRAQVINRAAQGGSKPTAARLDEECRMSKAWIRPHDIPVTGNDKPARSVFRYLWRMSGWHQIWICLLAGLVALLSMVPLELQRRLVDEVIVDRNLDLLIVLGGAYLAVLLAQGGCKLALRLYQGWLSESAIRYNREHLAQVHECRASSAETSGGNESKGQAVSVIGTEIDRLGGFVGQGLSQPVISGGMLIAIVGYMLFVEPLVAAFSLVFLLPQIVLVPLVQRYINRLIEERVTMICRTYNLI
jgi:ABC-type bacteriocin/lantibiotic exporter with double-glycine peptidase domain